MSTEPTLAEVIESAIESRLVDVHTSLPGRVVSYDSAKQVADIELVVKRAEVGASGAIVHEDFPVLPNVMVGWSSGGGYSMQFPLVKGDHVWVMFSEAALAQWRVTGEPSQPGDLERHGLSYPVAIPCLRSDKQPLPNASGGALVTTPSGGALSVSKAGGAPSAVAMADDVETELNRIKTDLATLKSAVATGLGAVGIGAAANGGTGATAFNSAAGSIPSNPGSVASANLKAE